MGRRSAPLSSANAANDLDPAHRKFLASSLDRNDVELLAIEKLNGQLRELRSLLVERYGELSLFPSDNNSSIKDSSSLSESRNEKEKLLLSFRLRMKLRRKLLNRLSRRLNRVAHFMDGEVSSLAAPPNPKYGDVRFELDSEKFERHQEACLKRDRAFEILQEKRRRLSNNLAEKYMLDAQQTLSLMEESNGDIQQEQMLQRGPEENPDAVPLSDLIEFDIGYNNITTGEEKRSTSVAEHEAPDYSTIKFGAGIGAAHKSMSSKEKEAEYARWSQDILARVPEQPTFDQLGMSDNDVFFLDERKKKLLEQQKKQQHDGDESSFEDLEEKLNVAVEEVKESEDLKQQNTGDASTSTADVKDGIQPEEIPKKMVYLSLQPVPSFAQQDLRRIRSIHADYVSATIFKQYKAKVDEATKEYNETVARSTELQNLKIKLQSDLHKLMVYSRSVVQKTRSEYAIDVAIARAKWQRRRDNWEAAQKARKLSQSDANTRLEIIHTLHLMVDQIERRASTTSENIDAPKDLLTSQDIVTEVVAVTAKDLVNTVVDRNIAPTPGPRGELSFGPTSNFEWNYDLSAEKFEDFVAPPVPSEIDTYTSSRKQEEQESNLRRQISTVETKFAASEEDRKRVWRKLQKLRAEYEQQQPHLSVPGSSAQQQQQQQTSAANSNVGRPRSVAQPSTASLSHQSQTQKHQASSSAVHSRSVMRQPVANTSSTSVPVVAPGTNEPSTVTPAAPPEAVSSDPHNFSPTSAEATGTSTDIAPPTAKQHSSTDDVPESLASTYSAAVESSGSLHSEDAGGQVLSKPGDKYGGKYSMEKVRERIFPGRRTDSLLRVPPPFHFSLFSHCIFLILSTFHCNSIPKYTYLYRWIGDASSGTKA